MFPRDSAESNRMEEAFGLFATVPGCSASCGSKTGGSSVRLGVVAGRCSWQAIRVKFAAINNTQEHFRAVHVMGAALPAEDHRQLTQAAPPAVEQVRASVRANREWLVECGEGRPQQVQNRWLLGVWLSS